MSKQRETVEQKEESATAETLDSAAAEAAPGDETRVVVRTTKVGRFLLLREIGSGGMGRVYAAYDEQLDRRVALKLLRKPRSGSRRQRMMVLREARAAARIAHPSVISIFDIGEIDGQIHIAMEYVEGETLLKWQKDSQRSWRDILNMYLEVGQALQAAHQAEVIHRDFKPDNVLVGRDGRPKVVDFGLAQVGLSDSVPEGEMPATVDAAVKLSPVDPGGRFTLSGVVAGTPGYMSPEQCGGNQIDQRSDQWSFCAALFEGLYGVLPFDGKTLKEFTESVYGPIRRPPSPTNIPDDIYQILRRGLSPDPKDRFTGMQELLDALSLEHGEHVGSGAITRRRLSMSLVGVSVLTFCATQIRLWERPLLHREGIAVSVVMLLALLIGGLLQRRVLREQLFHRSVFVLLLVSISQNFLQRVFSALIGTPLWKMVPFEMIVLAGNITLGTTLFMRRNRWAGLIPLSYAIITLLANVPYRLSSFVYVGSVIVFFYTWRSAAASVARRHPRDAGTFSAMLGIRTPWTGRTPSRPSSSRPSSGVPKSSPEFTPSHPQNP